MKLKPWQVKFMMNIFPALFFNRVRVKRVSSDFCEMDVRVKLSIFNRNLQGSIFGGIVSATSKQVTGIPTGTIWVRLWTRIGNVWQPPLDYSFTR